MLLFDVQSYCRLQSQHTDQEGLTLPVVKHCGKRAQADVVLQGGQDYQRCFPPEFQAETGASLQMIGAEEQDWSYKQLIVRNLSVMRRGNGYIRHDGDGDAGGSDGVQNYSSS